jgi:hypothetical protein
MESATAGPAATTRRTPDPVLILGVLAVLSLALIPVEIHSLFGLPAHPLLLHVPVVFIPILALALLAVAAKPEWLDRHGLAIGALAVVSLASTILTAGAGEAFRDSGEGGPGIAEHADAGETLRLVMIGLTAVVLIALALRRAAAGQGLARLQGLGRQAWVSPATRAAFAILAVVAAFFVIRTGHLGAKQTWGDKGKEGRPPAGAPAPGRDGDGDGG